MPTAVPVEAAASSPHWVAAPLKSSHDFAVNSCSSGNMPGGGGGGGLTTLPIAESTVSRKLSSCASVDQLILVVYSKDEASCSAARATPP